MGTDINQVAWDNAHSTAKEIMTKANVNNLHDAFFYFFEGSGLNSGEFKIESEDGNYKYIAGPRSFDSNNVEFNLDNISKILYEIHFKYM